MMLSEALELEATKIAAGSPIRLEQTSTRGFWRCQPPPLHPTEHREEQELRYWY
jgi:hypothetical protein